MELFDNHKYLFGTATFLFVALTVFVAILPAMHNQQNNGPLPGAQELSEAERRGKALFVANGCVACHTQQVRNVDMDRVWGPRPGIAADYALMRRTDIWRNTATLMGTERTGPDLTNIGNRQPSKEWNLVHLFNPRIVVKESIMPAYPWLFESKQPLPSDVVVNVPEAFRGKWKGSVVATQDALDLVAYLQSLKQIQLSDGLPAPDFLYQRTEAAAASLDETGVKANGQALFAANCQACHQENGEGLPGAFPPLKESKIVTGDNLELYVDIIMNGYDADPAYAAMPGIGTAMAFTEDDVAAIINHERSSWGNTGKPVTPEEIKEIMDAIQFK